MLWPRGRGKLAFFHNAREPSSQLTLMSCYYPLLSYLIVSRRKNRRIFYQLQLKILREMMTSPRNQIRIIWAAEVLNNNNRRSWTSCRINWRKKHLNPLFAMNSAKNLSKIHLRMVIFSRFSHCFLFITVNLSGMVSFKEIWDGASHAG